ncbi:MAG: divalent metal cation transporter, partial [Haemophilus parainfluenzae]|nr:divalent metal cation transporter [Haemophilus parainfluenzae]
INTAAVGLLTAAILTFITPIPLPMPVLSSLVILVTTGILLLGKYRLLDSLSKIIMIALTVTTVSAVVIAFMRNGIHGVAAPDFVPPSPWELSKLAFLVALMGWMPAPIEISAINSMWVVAKRRLTKVSYQDGLFDFNVGYIGTAILAVVFLALGALVQYGSPETVEMVGGKYIAQLINMYASTIGEWSRLLIAVIAFMCMFGTTITVIDGYSRTNVEALRILFGKQESSVRVLNIGMILAALSGLAIIFYFNNAVGPMLKFAMIASFVSAPIFAWLNLSLTKHAKHSVKGGLLWLSLIGLFYLTAFAGLFIASESGFLNWLFDKLIG